VLLTRWWSYLKTGGGQTRIPLGQDTLHAQEEGLLDLDGVRSAVVVIGGWVLDAIWTADGRVRLGEL